MPNPYYEVPVMPEMSLKLLLTKEEFDRYPGANGHEWPNGGDRAITFRDDMDIFVAYDMEAGIAKETALEEMLAMLAHESYHAAEYQCEIIGEVEPASEEMAYMVQGASCSLFCELFDWLEAR